MQLRFSVKGAATLLKVEIRLRAHQVYTNTWSGTEVIFTLIWLAHAFGTIGYFARGLTLNLNDGTATLNNAFSLATKRW